MPTTIKAAIPLTSNIEQAIYEESAQLAKEKYNGHISSSMSILYSKLRSSGEREASATAFELLKRLESSDTEQQDDDEEVIKKTCVKKLTQVVFGLFHQRTQSGHFEGKGKKFC